jgi:hypothetical protein
MKKITLSIGLLAGILTSSAQDTTCTMFSKKLVLEFNYQTNEILNREEQSDKFYNITVKYGDVLCLHLYDKKSRIRRIITTFFDGSTREDILESKDNVYYSPQGATQVSVGRPKFFIAGTGACR